jgi:hypothetical protein
VSPPVQPVGAFAPVAPANGTSDASRVARPPTTLPVDGRSSAAEHTAPRAEGVSATSAPIAGDHAPRPAEPSTGPVPATGGEFRGTTCTTPQLRRFIKSRPWVPMHELRRRFGIWGGDDDVTPMRVGDQQLYVGLPPAESQMLAELLGGGDVGYELSLDPGAPIVVGVYPMRPVPRS